MKVHPPSPQPSHLLFPSNTQMAVRRCYNFIYEYVGTKIVHTLQKRIVSNREFFVYQKEASKKGQIFNKDLFLSRPPSNLPLKQKQDA